MNDHAKNKQSVTILTELQNSALQYDMRGMVVVSPCLTGRMARLVSRLVDEVRGWRAVLPRPTETRRRLKFATTLSGLQFLWGYKYKLIS